MITKLLNVLAMLMGIITAILIVSIVGCGKNSNNCNPNSGTAQYNGDTVNLIDGTCTMTTQTVWKNPAYTEYLICNKRWTVQNGIVCNLDPETIIASTTGCTPMGDGYQTSPNNPSTPTEQCWFNIKNGMINDSTPPTF